MTPGPWRTVRLASSFDSRIVGYGIAYGRSGTRLAIVDGEGNSSNHNDDNARLIAAAPEMLAALCDLLDLIARDELIPESLSYMREARAAIAKATGENA